jgi:hypothetical protein
MPYQDPNQLNLPFDNHSIGKNVQNENNVIQEMLDCEFAQKYPNGYESKPLFGAVPYAEPTPPQGWLSEIQAIETSGINPLLFESMLLGMDPNRHEGAGRPTVFISEAWLQFYHMDPGFASQQMFMRFTAEPYADLEFLNYRHADSFKRVKHTPSSKQLGALWKLLENPLLTTAERWFIELCKTDNRITKAEVSLLLQHFFGESDWDGRRRVYYSDGVLRRRQNTQ